MVVNKSIPRQIAGNELKYEPNYFSHIAEE